MYSLSSACERCSGERWGGERRCRIRDRDERGAATAELAMALPMLVGVTLGLVWLLVVGLDQLRMIDAARETARALARGEPDAAAIAAGIRVAPDGAVITVTTSGNEVSAQVTATVARPGGLVAFLPGVHLHARAVAEREPGP